MKVVKEGKWDNPWSAELSCGNDNCGATLLVEEGDVIPTYDSRNKFHFICPICESVTYIPPANLPPRIKNALEAKRDYDRD
jgi:hypothetical protein